MVGAGADAGGSSQGTVNISVWTTQPPNELKGQIHICVYNNDLVDAVLKRWSGECATKYGYMDGTIPSADVVTSWSSPVTYDFDTNYRTQATAFKQSIQLPVNVDSDYLVLVFLGGTTSTCDGVPPWNGPMFAGIGVGIPQAGTVVDFTQEMFFYNSFDPTAHFWPHFSPCKY